MATKTDNKYYEAVGRRKTATARVRITPSSKMSYVINDKALAEYFRTGELQKTLTDTFSKTKIEDTFSVSVKVFGSGISAQAEAVRHGIARALVKLDEEHKSPLKKLGYLKRDPRSKERRKAGMAGKARKGKQWSKR
jgi:small subunit ribosomal protein S9